MNTKKLLAVVSGLILSTAIYAQPSFSFSTPTKVERVLKLSGNNRTELENVLRHYAQARDSQKWKAACFLIENMDIHFSEQFYWEKP